MQRIQDIMSKNTIFPQGFCIDQLINELLRERLKFWFLPNHSMIFRLTRDRDLICSHHHFSMNIPLKKSGMFETPWLQV